MLLNKELLAGIFGSTKNIEFNISWNTQTCTITGYFDPQNPFPYNELDRPRINTWRGDGTKVIYLSAGRDVYNPQTQTITQPWGDRRTGTQQVNIALNGTLPAGIDFFTDSRFAAPTFVPATGWTSSATGNENEIRYQYTVSAASSGVQNISITIN